MANAQGHTGIQQNQSATQIWQLKTIRIDLNHVETINEEIQQQFEQTVQYISNRYYVQWLWNGKQHDLETNFPIAYYRLASVMKHLMTQPEIKLKYKAIFDEQEKEGIIEKIKITTPGQIISYVPHHLVEHKFRPVFDC